MDIECTMDLARDAGQVREWLEDAGYSECGISCFGDGTVVIHGASASDEPRIRELLKEKESAPVIDLRKQVIDELMATVALALTQNATLADIQAGLQAVAKYVGLVKYDYRQPE